MIGGTLETHLYEALEQATLYFGAAGGQSSLTLSDILRAKKTGKWKDMRKNLTSIRKGAGDLPANPIPPQVEHPSNPKGNNLARAIATKASLRVCEEVTLVPRVRPANTVYHQYRTAGVVDMVQGYINARKPIDIGITEEQAIDELFPKGLLSLDVAEYIIPKFHQKPNNTTYSQEAWRAVVSIYEAATREGDETMILHLKTFMINYKGIATTYFYGNGGNLGKLGRLEYAGSNHTKAMALPQPTREELWRAYETMSPVSELPKAFTLTHDPIEWATGGKYDFTHEGKPTSMTLPKINPKADPGVPWNNVLKADTALSDLTIFSRFMGDVALVTEGNMTRDQLDARWGFGRIKELKGKKEPYEETKLDRKIRVIAVPGCLEIGGLWLVQASGAVKNNIMNHPTSRSLYGVTFMRGGLDRLLNLVYQECVSAGFSVMYYADNCFITLRERDQHIMISIDGVAQESSNSAYKLKVGARHWVGKLFGCSWDRNGVPQPNERITLPWIYYLCEILPEWSGNWIGLMENMQLSMHYLASGIPGTFKANDHCMAPAALKVMESLQNNPGARTTAYWLTTNSEGTHSPTRDCSNAFAAGQVIPRVERCAADETGLRFAWEHPIDLLTEGGEVYGIADLDLLGNSAVAIKVGDMKMWAPVLQRKRMYRAIVLRKTTLESIDNPLVRAATQLFIYCTLYVVGGFMPEFDMGIKAIAMSIQQRFLEAGGIEVLRTGLREEAETEAYTTLATLGIEKEQLSSLSGAMAECLTKGLPTIEGVIRILCGDALADNYARLVKETIPEAKWGSLLSDDSVDNESKVPKPGILDPMSPAPMHLAGVKSNPRRITSLHPINIPNAHTETRRGEGIPINANIAGPTRRPAGPNSDEDTEALLDEMAKRLNNRTHSHITATAPNADALTKLNKMTQIGATTAQFIAALSSEYNSTFAKLWTAGKPIFKQLEGMSLIHVVGPNAINDESMHVANMGSRAITGISSL